MSTSTVPLESLTSNLFVQTGSGGVLARTGLFERVIDGLLLAITKMGHPDTERFRFPPVMARGMVERSGYVKNFPHLLGVVSNLAGSEQDIRALVEGRSPGKEWTDGLRPTELVLSPAACYPLYPVIAERGPVSTEGEIFDVESYCFRREASSEPGRMQSFRMREYVCIGSPDVAEGFRRQWMPRGEQFATDLGLSYKLAPASDPFFGRGGRMMAIGQMEQSLKFELLIPIISEEQPTACMSFNYAQDHFGTTWDMRTDDGNVAHSSCVAFGVDRLGLALFAAHGLDLAAWPSSARRTLSLD